MHIVTANSKSTTFNYILSPVRFDSDYCGCYSLGSHSAFTAHLSPKVTRERLLNSEIARMFQVPRTYLIFPEVYAKLSQIYFFSGLKF